MTTFVIRRNSDVDVLGRGVGIAEGNDRDVDIGSFFDSLSIGSGIGHDDETRLLERSSDVVGEATGSEATSDGDSTGVGGELEHSSLAVGTSGDDTDVCWVVDGGDDSRCKDNLLPVADISFSCRLKRCGNIPSLREVDDIDSVWTCLP